MMPWPSKRLEIPRGDTLVRVNLGCGLDYREGWVNVDWNPTGALRVDRSFNLEDIPWPMADHSVDYILMSHVAEHLRHGLLYGVTRRILTVLKHVAAGKPLSDADVQDIERLAAKDGWLAVIEEAYRILRPGGLLDVVAPGPWTPDAWRDPTHARALEPDFWTYVSPDSIPTRRFYTTARFRLLRQEHLRSLDFRAPFRWIHFKDYHADKYL
ncbi:MAG: hypothetical protein ACREA0_35450, partial [bacterium]